MDRLCGCRTTADRRYAANFSSQQTFPKAYGTLATFQKKDTLASRHREERKTLCGDHVRWPYSGTKQNLKKHNQATTIFYHKPRAYTTTIFHTHLKRPSLLKMTVTILDSRTNACVASLARALKRTRHCCSDNARLLETMDHRCTHELAIASPLAGRHIATAMFRADWIARVQDCPMQVHPLHSLRLSFTRHKGCRRSSSAASHREDKFALPRGRRSSHSPASGFRTCQANMDFPCGASSTQYLPSPSDPSPLVLPPLQAQSVEP